jgi:hypothetical protein
MVAERERYRREARERVASFIAVMLENSIDPIAVYRRSEHDVLRDDGIFRRKMVVTGQKRFTHALIGHGWPIDEAGNDSDYNPRILTIMDTGQFYETSYLQERQYSDTPEVPYVVTGHDEDGPYEEVSLFMGERGEQRLAYAAIRLMAE